MKLIQTFLILLSLCTVISAQDVIVLKDNNVINCKIDSVTLNSIYFTFRKNNKEISTYLGKNKVMGYRYGKNNIVAEDLKETNLYTFNRFSFSAGYSYRYAKMKEGLELNEINHLNKLRNGYYLGCDFEFYYKNIGFGIKFNRAISTNTFYASFVVDGMVMNGDLKENIGISFFGPLFTSRYIFPGGLVVFRTNISPGLFLLTDKAEFAGQNIKATGNTFGLSGSFGVDIKLTNFLFCGFEAVGNAGTITKYKIDGKEEKLEEEDYNNIGWIGISAGLRLVF